MTTSSKKNVHDAISELCALYEYGELQAVTDPAEFILVVVDEIRDLRKKLVEFQLQTVSD